MLENLLIVENYFVDFISFRILGETNPIIGQLDTNLKGLEWEEHPKMALRFCREDPDLVLIKQAHSPVQIASGSSAMHSLPQALSVPKILDIKPDPLAQEMLC